jgi:hypothetical protein
MFHVKHICLIVNIYYSKIIIFVLCMFKNYFPGNNFLMFHVKQLLLFYKAKNVDDVLCHLH